MGEKKPTGSASVALNLLLIVVGGTLGLLLAPWLLPEMDPGSRETLGVGVGAVLVFSLVQRLRR